MTFPVTALRAWAIGILVSYWTLCLLMTHWPDTPGGVDDGLSDKTLHYIGYAGLGFFLLAGLTSYRPWRGSHVGWVWLVTALYGIFDEYTQQFFDRETDVYDWYADVVGSLSGTVLFTCLWFAAQWWGRIVFVYPEREGEVSSSRKSVSASPGPVEETLRPS